MRLEVIIFALGAVCLRISECHPNGDLASGKWGRRISSAKEIIEKANEVFETVKEVAEEWDISTVSDITGMISPWIEVGIPLFGALIEGFIENPEMKEIRKGFKRIEEELQSVTANMDKSMKNIAEAHSTTLSLRESQDIIIINKELVNLMDETSPDNRIKAIEGYLKMYQARGKGSSLLTLYRSLQEHTLRSLSDAAHGDCDDFRRSGRIFKNIIFMGIQNHIAALVLGRAPDVVVDAACAEWTHKMKEITDIVDVFFKKCKCHFQKSVLQIIREVLENTKVKSKEMPEVLLKTLRSKYDFMYWLVLVYKPIDLEVEDGIRGTSVIESELVNKRRAVVGFTHKSGQLDSNFDCEKLKHYAKQLFSGAEVSEFSDLITNHHLSPNSIVITLTKSKSWTSILHKQVKVYQSSDFPEERLCKIKEEHSDNIHETWFF